MCYTLHGSRLVDAMGELNPLLKRCGGTDYRFGTDKCHHSTAGAVSSKCESRVSLYAKHLQNPRVPRLPFGSRVFFFFSDLLRRESSAAAAAAIMVAVKKSVISLSLSLTLFLDSFSWK